MSNDAKTKADLSLFYEHLRAFIIDDGTYETLSTGYYAKYIEPAVLRTVQEVKASALAQAEKAFKLSGGCDYCEENTKTSCYENHSSEFHTSAEEFIECLRGEKTK